MIPLRFFGEEDGKVQELLSGPFHSQGFHFTCEPAEAVLQEFFTLSTWWLFDPLQSPEVGAESPLPRTPGSPQVACLLQPRSNVPNPWSLQPIPGQVQLALRLSSGPAASVKQLNRPLNWTFVPQFQVFDKSGERTLAGQVLGSLTADSSSFSATIWTGGFPVQVSLDRQPRAGSVRVQLQLPPTKGWERRPSLPVLVLWHKPADIDVEELELRVESQLTWQVETFRLRVGVAPEERRIRLFPLMLIALGLGLMAAGRWLCRRPSRSTKPWLVNKELRSKTDDARGVSSSAALSSSLQVSPFRPIFIK